jgi:hypothetical protein
VINLLDDHSQYLLATMAGPAATTDMAWDTFEVAANRYGLPRQVLSDNGLAFTGRLRSFEVIFETNLRDLGVELINAAPYHPQTLGKLERFHRTLEEWLSDEGPAWDLEHLQELLDGFRFHYNRHRPHQGIDDATPAERYDPGGPTENLPEPPTIRTPEYPPARYSAESPPPATSAITRNSSKSDTGGPAPPSGSSPSATSPTSTTAKPSSEPSPSTPTATTRTQTTPTYQQANNQDSMKPVR